MNSTKLQPGNGYRIPRQAYYEQEWFDREQKLLFPASWNFVGTTTELSTPGAYISTCVGPYPIALVVGEDGVVRGFHNLCRHRGAKLLDGKGTCRTITCPYHRWQYSLDGSLNNVPQSADQIPLLNTEDWGLKPVKIATWMGLIFVNPDGTAPDFEIWIDRVPEFLDTYKLDQLTELDQIEYEFDANWKVYIENHIDWYHLWYVHAKTLRNLDHHAGKMHFLGPHFVSYDPYKNPDLEIPPFQPLKGLSEESKSTGAHLLFPNLTLFSDSSWFGIGHITPISPIRTRMSFRLFALPDQDPKKFFDMFHQVTQIEDAEAAARIQATVQSPAFSVGPLTKDFELAITRFHDYYLEKLSV